MKATFNIGYFSAKEKKLDIRRAKEDKKTKKGVAKNGTKCYNYYD